MSIDQEQKKEPELFCITEKGMARVAMLKEKERKNLIKAAEEKIRSIDIKMCFEKIYEN